MQHLLLVNSQGVGAYVDRGRSPVLMIPQGDGKGVQAHSARKDGFALVNEELEAVIVSGRLTHKLYNIAQP